MKLILKEPRSTCLPPDLLNALHSPRTLYGNKSCVYNNNGIIVINYSFLYLQFFSVNYLVYEVDTLISLSLILVSESERISTTLHILSLCFILE